MSESKHTPGPWEWVRRKSDSGNFFYLHNTTGPMILAAEEYAGASWIEVENAADARLIAAAPDLLAALKALDSNGHTQATWALALKAIAKAEGK